MKKIMLLLIMLSVICFINVKADGVCYNETHYYYFLYQQVSEYECYNIEDNKKVQTTCDNASVKTTEEDIWGNLTTNLETTSTAVFSNLYLPDEYKIKSVDTEPVTTLTKEDFYYLFDALINQNILTDKDKDNIIEVDDNFVYQKKEADRITYYHLIGDYKYGQTNFLSDVKKHYDSLTKEEQIEYRDVLVNILYNRQLSVKAYLGVGDKEDFKVLDKDNLDSIYNKDANPAIKRVISAEEMIEPIYYYNTKTMRTMAYVVPMKVEVNIESKCDRTCKDVNEEYAGCVDSETCNDNLIAEYEKCHPLESINNPRTSDLNRVLVILVIIGTIFVFYATYREKKKNRHTI